MDEKKEKRHGTDAEDVKEILGVVSEKIPALLNSLTDVLYGKQQAEKYGTAVAGFYKSMKDAGMNEAQAFELTKQYMSSLNLPGMIGEAIKGRSGRGDKGIHIEVPGDDDDEDDDDEDEA
jgi:hypothetical protein